MVATDAGESAGLVKGMSTTTSQARGHSSAYAEDILSQQRLRTRLGREDKDGWVIYDGYGRSEWQTRENWNKLEDGVDEEEEVEGVYRSCTHKVKMKA